jgi:uncharacterized membrane protein
MNADQPSLWTRLRRSLRSRLVSGILVLIPLGFTFLVLRFLYNATAGALAPLITRTFGTLPEVLLMVLSVLALLVLVYLVGVVTAHMLGRRLLALGEALLRRIPLVKPIYSGVKQVIQTFSASDAQSFKRVVFIEYPRPGLKAVGFVTGETELPDGRRFYRVFLPSALTPTAGALEFVPVEAAEDAGLSVEEAMRMLISCGILAPDHLGQSRPEVPSAGSSAPE